MLPKGGLVALLISAISSNFQTRASHIDHWHAIEELKHQHVFNDIPKSPSNDVWGRVDLNESEEEEEWGSSNFNKNPKNLRLPMEVTPLHYTLKITPILEENSGIGEQWTAPAEITILVKGAKEENRVTLNAVELNISSVEILEKQTGNPIAVVSHNYNRLRADQYIISLKEPLQNDVEYEMKLIFVAPVSQDHPEGLYLSEYQDPETKELKYLASTQFEFFAARQAFPCFDEPYLKTPFDISVGRSSQFQSRSNSDMVSSLPMNEHPGWFIDKYATTPRMSTYLVAILVSDFTFAEADLSIFGNRSSRVYGPKHLIDQGAGNFGANITAQVLSFYEDYFGVKYPLQKMDAAAVPGFLYGAMENYGLNIYRESILLTIPGRTSESHYSRSSSVIAHESAHQYFGNIVTCKFWDNIWLNEGFATYYSYVGQNFTNPEYEPMKQLLVDGPQFAFMLDSKDRSSYPLLLNAKTMNQFESQVIGLPYYKGASLIRMMIAFLTPATFHKGIRQYLSKWEHGAVEQDDLFEALTEQGQMDGTLPMNWTVKQIMDPWTKQRGFPLVRVIASDENTVYVLYEKFQSVSMTKDSSHSFWTIPVSFVTQDDPDFEDHQPKLWITEGTVVKSFEHNTSRWIIVNHETTGYYRVVYDKKLTRLLQKQFRRNFSMISVESRSQILDDYLTLGMQSNMWLNSYVHHYNKEESSFHVLL